MGAKRNWIGRISGHKRTRNRANINRDMSTAYRRLEDRRVLNADIGQLVFQADFEDVKVEQGSFDFFKDVSGLAATDGAVEVQNNVPLVGPASQGQNHLELDGTNGVRVDIDNQKYQGFVLSFDYSSRPGVGESQTAIDVYWDGVLYQTVSNDGQELKTTDFHNVEIQLPLATGSSGQLEFRSDSPDDTAGMGGLIDNIRLVGLDAVGKSVPIADGLSTQETPPLIPAGGTQPIVFSGEGILFSNSGSSTPGTPFESSALVVFDLDTESFDWTSADPVHGEIVLQAIPYVGTLNGDTLTFEATFEDIRWFGTIELNSPNDSVITVSENANAARYLLAEKI